MTETEKIKELLKLNNFCAAIVVNEDAYINGANEFAFKELYSVKVGGSLYNIFDKNTALLVKNNLIDVKVFKKIQRRKVSVLINNTSRKLQLIISPFSINNKTFFYILMFDENTEDNLIAYPTIDDNDIKLKYKSIFQQVGKAFHYTLIEKKNFQFDLDIERVPITIRANDNYIFANDSFAKFIHLQNDEILEKKQIQVFELPLAEKLEQVETLIYSTQNMIVVESIEYSPDDFQQKNRIACTPIYDDEKNIIATINFGGINPKRNEDKIIKAIDDSEEKRETEIETVVSVKNKRTFDDKTGEAKIIYDKNTFKILEANQSSAKLYGYSLNELLKMDITELCAPEDMQKLLAPINDTNEGLDFNHIKNDGSNILVEVIQENIKWKNIEAIQSIIFLKEEIKPPEEKVTEIKAESENEKVLEETIIQEDFKPNVEKEISKKEVPQKEIVEKEISKKEYTSATPFLSSLFHELLTPVNVILGFVQEIIDSIDKPTEEQAESAQIIRTNQQLLLQTMNTAVQYAQISEGYAKQNIEEFKLNKYLLDIKDSITKISEKENVEVNFENIPDDLTLKNDRKKLLAAISYFLKFAIKLTSSKKIIVSFKKDSNQFKVLINDEDGNISEKFIYEIKEIYRADNNLEKNNFKISPISIRLAKKLNEITFGEIKEYSLDNKNTITLVFPIIAEDFNVDEQDTETIVVPVEPKEEVIEKIKADKIEITETKIEEKIIEDIDEEEEIDTEEIATIEKIHTNEKTITESETDGVELSKLSCLLIEDSIDSQLLFKAQMRDFKLLKMASSLTDALPLVKKYNFDLIYVDINLQGQYNGLDALKIIRQFENYKTIPIIAVTSYPFEGDKTSFISAGFNDYFVKPLLREQLLSSISSLF